MKCHCHPIPGYSGVCKSKTPSQVRKDFEKFMKRLNKFEADSRKSFLKDKRKIK